MGLVLRGRHGPGCLPFDIVLRPFRVVASISSCTSPPKSVHVLRAGDGTSCSAVAIPRFDSVSSLDHRRPGSENLQSSGPPHGVREAGRTRHSRVDTSFRVILARPAAAEGAVATIPCRCLTLGSAGHLDGLRPCGCCSRQAKSGGCAPGWPEPRATLMRLSGRKLLRWTLGQETTRLS